MPLFNAEKYQGLHVLVVAGEIDLSSRTYFRAALEALDTAAPRVLVDFCRCKYFDSSAINELLRFRRTRGEQQIDVSMPHPFGRRIFSITNLDQIFPIVDCVHA